MMKVRSVTSGLSIVALACLGGGARGEASCRVVEFVDGHGRPVVGADVTLYGCDVDTGACGQYVAWATNINLWHWKTDRRGRVCGEELLDPHTSAALEVVGPNRAGGRCANRKRWTYPDGVPGGRGPAPIVVKLDGPRLPAALLAGRIVSADGRPIARATI